MNILEYGMKYENSNSKMRRLVARCILEAEKRRADHCETRMNKKRITVSQNPEDTAAMLRSIRSQIARIKPEESAGDRKTADHGQGADSG